MYRYTIFTTPFLAPFLRALSRVYLWVIGWRAVGIVPANTKHYVVIGAPHTSNWDFPIMVALAFILGAPVHWMGKDALFRFPFGGLTRWLGGISIDRTKANSVVSRSVQLFRENDELVLLIPAEGTRRWTPYWKSGFYHIALGAGVPVVLGVLDYGRKEGGFGPAIRLSGDPEADMGRIAAYYADKTPKFPSQKSPVRLSPDQYPVKQAVSGEPSP